MGEIEMEAKDMDYKELIRLRKELAEHPIYGPVYRENDNRSLWWCREASAARKRCEELEDEIVNLKRDIKLIGKRRNVLRRK
jgi:hypothetical protein